MASVHILLSSFNGEAWLPDLLTSLEGQTFTDWQLVIRDDGSVDNTVDVLRHWCEQHPEKVYELEIDGEHLGCKLSFSRLMGKSDAPYLMFCDQDDVWLPEKIEQALAELQCLEQQYQDMPLMVHSDLILVDQQLNITDLSFWQKRQFSPQQSADHYWLHNIVTGCATLFNRRAADMAFPVPTEAIQHDHWLALVCARFGVIKAIERPLLLYRQHPKNLVGAASFQVKNWRAIARRIHAWSAQASAFVGRFGQHLQGERDARLRALADLPALNGRKKRITILQQGLFKPGLMANIALLIFV